MIDRALRPASPVLNYSAGWLGLQRLGPDQYCATPALETLRARRACQPSWRWPRPEDSA